MRFLRMHPSSLWIRDSGISLLAATPDSLGSTVVRSLGFGSAKLREKQERRGNQKNINKERNKRRQSFSLHTNKKIDYREKGKESLPTALLPALSSSLSSCSFIVRVLIHSHLREKHTYTYTHSYSHSQTQTRTLVTGANNSTRIREMEREREKADCQLDAQTQIAATAGKR